MNILNEVFDQVYIITCPYTQDRLPSLMEKLKKEKINYHLIFAPRKEYLKRVTYAKYTFDEWSVSRGNRSCWSGNESAFLHAKHNNYNTICIMEDDIYFAKDYKKKLKVFFEEVPHDWEILNLGWHVWNYPQDLNPIYERIEANSKITGCHIIGYRFVLDYMIDKWENCKEPRPTDNFLLESVFHERISYTAKEKMFIQSSIRDNEPDSNMYYKMYPTQIDD